MKTERYYVFFTGQASAPTSVGIMDKETGNDIKRIPLWYLRTGKEIRAEYNRLRKEFTKECEVLNS